MCVVVVVVLVVVVTTMTRILPRISTALAAFVWGVLTPPSMHVIYHQYANNSSSTTSPPLPYPLPTYTPCIPSNLVNYLHAAPVSGLHVVCVSPLHLGEDGTDQPLPISSNVQEQYSTLNNVESIRLTFYKESHSPPIMNNQVKVGGKLTNGSYHGGSNGGGSSIDWQEMRMQLYAQLGLEPEGKLQQPWAVFTPIGERIIGDNDEVTSGDGIGSNKHIMNSIIASGMIIVTQGGNWIWPGVREGFQRTVLLSSLSDTMSEPRNVTLETLSLKPLVLSIQGFLTEEECNHIAETAAPSMSYSGVSLKDADVGKAASNWRTSQSTFLSARNDPILIDIEHRTASLTRVPRSHQEYVQVLRYGSTEKYDAHHDFFDPAHYQSDKNTLNLIEHGKKNRFATVFWYLTDVEDGGHTIFPRAGGLPPMNNFADCSRGLKVKPQKGKVIIFYSLDASGTRDDLSLHGACPVGEGNVKWAANKWVWNAPMGYITS